MKRCLALWIVFMLIAAGAAYAAPKDRGTAKEAVALVKKAVAHVNEKGQEKALREFSDPKGRFIHKDLYILVVDTDGKCLAHGVTPSLIGKNFMSLKDSTGVQFIKKMIDLAKAKGSGRVDYKWTNPASRKLENKSTYVERAGNLVIGCGYYK